MPKRVYTQPILQEAVTHSTSFAGVLRFLGLKQAGGTQAHIANMIRRFEIDMSHFTGKGHQRGKPSLNRKSADQVLVLGDPLKSQRTHRGLLLRCMLEIGIAYECAECTLGPEWNGKALTLEIDHRNGNWWDNRPSNLRFLCPNCHAQQSHTSMPHKYRKSVVH